MMIDSGTVLKHLLGLRPADEKVYNNKLNIIHLKYKMKKEKKNKNKLIGWVSKLNGLKQII